MNNDYELTLAQSKEIWKAFEEYTGTPALFELKKLYPRGTMQLITAAMLATAEVINKRYNILELCDVLHDNYDSAF